MNESAQVSGVTSILGEARANHLQAINEHRKAIDRHQRGIQAHLKSILDFDDDEDTEDPPFEGEGEAEAEDADGKAFLMELQQWAEQAQELATT